MRHVLMIAYHFPPFQGSSGIQRTLRFVRYLPEFDWHPVVLAPHSRAYPNCSNDMLADIPAGIAVHRAFALDTGRHLAFRGHYLRWMALPDRYVSWLFGAVPAGLSLIRKFKPKAIWSTYPIATAHLIGYALHRLTGLPWVADFRDPMLYEAWPEERTQRWVNGWIERRTVHHATRSVCVTGSAVELYRNRYPSIPAERFGMISNGYDEQSFDGLAQPPATAPGARPLTLVHSGSLEPADRDPADFLRAIAQLKAAGRIQRGDLKVILRGSGFEQRYSEEIARLGIGEFITLPATVGYREALAELVAADGLLLFQGPTCNRQIPAKLYEYLRAGTPIFAIAAVAGDTYRLLAAMGCGTLVPFGPPERIAAELGKFLNLLRTGRSERTAKSVYERYERRALTGDLARMLDEVTER